MPRETDPKRTRKALRIVRKLAARAHSEEIDPETGEVKPVDKSADYSDWEKTFLTEVEGRLEKYGSAFHDLSKGGAEEALSRLQTGKLKEIAAKAKAKTKAGGKDRKPLTARKRLMGKKPLRARRSPKAS